MALPVGRGATIRRVGLPPSLESSRVERLRQEDEYVTSCEDDTPSQISCFLWTLRLMLGKLNCNKEGVLLEPVVVGSRMTGTHVSGFSDVDVCIPVSASLRETLGGAEGETAFSALALRELAAELKGEVGDSRVTLFDGARVPVVKIEHKYGLTSIDIIVGHDLGIHNGKLISEYLKLHPVVKDLICQVKTWARVEGLVGPQMLSSYAWTIMVLFFLMISARCLPSLQVLHSQFPVKSVTGTKETRCWAVKRVIDTRYVSAELAKTKMQRLDLRPFPLTALPLLHAFFRFYAWEFDWKSQTVDIKNPVSALEKRLFRHNVAAILCPFEFSTRNLARFLKLKDLKKLLSCLSAAAEAAKD